MFPMWTYVVKLIKNLILFFKKYYDKKMVLFCNHCAGN